MVVLGLILIAVGALAIVGGVFTAQVTNGHVEYLGVNVGAVGLFLIGVAAAVAILWGWSLFRWGFRRSRERRRDQKRLNKLAAQVEATEARRREDGDAEVADAERENRRTL